MDDRVHRGWQGLRLALTIAGCLLVTACETPQSSQSPGDESRTDETSESASPAEPRDEDRGPPDASVEANPAAKPDMNAPAWACSPEQAPRRATDWLESTLRTRSTKLAKVLDRAEARRIQILVGEVVRTDGGEPCVRYSSFRLGAEYFYPASAIKTVGSVAALDALESTDGWGVDDPIRFEPMSLDGVDGAPGVVSTARETTLRELLDETLVVSSNESFNGLYDIAGRDALNEHSWEHGLASVRLHHRLGRTRAAQKTHAVSPAFDVQLDETWRDVGSTRRSNVELPPHPAPDPTLGEGYIDPMTGDRVGAPMDFGEKNGMSLRDLLAVVAAVARPDITGDFDLGLEDDSRELMRELMERRPAGADEAETRAREARYKPLSPGVLEALGGDRQRFRYVNKAGRAYGFHLDAAYVEDTESGRAFFVAATIWANANRILNDNEYEYDALSYPFLVELGRVLAVELLVDK